MKINHPWLTTLILFLFFSAALPAQATPLHLVAAENFYGDVAKELAGPYAEVVSIMSNPNQDPHLFSATPSIAKALADANVIVYNGAGYDSWIERLLHVNGKSQKKIIVIAQIMKTPDGENPHLWYNPIVMPAYAKTFTQLLIQKDPTNKNYYQHQLQKFMRHYQILLKHIANIKKKYQGVDVSATEPVFNYMADALGFKMHGQNLQLSIMNDIAPSPSQIKNFENDLRQHKVKILIYNNQVSDPVTLRLQKIATKNNIPVIGVSETQPKDKDFVSWMDEQLSQIESALGKR